MSDEEQEEQNAVFDYVRSLVRRREIERGPMGYRNKTLSTSVTCWEELAEVECHEEDDIIT